MTTKIALLKGINVGGNRRIPMADLREFCTTIGFRDVQSLLQTGNIVFETDIDDGAELERVLESEADERLGLRTDFFVRSPEEWKAILDGNPFPEEAAGDPSHLLIGFLKDTPEPGAVDTLQADIRGPEKVRDAGSREVYLVYPDGIGRSRVTGPFIEKRLRVSGTARNWNTVLKIDAVANG